MRLLYSDVFVSVSPVDYDLSLFTGFGLCPGVSSCLADFPSGMQECLG